MRENTIFGQMVHLLFRKAFNTKHTASTIAALYKRQRQIEPNCRWIKQYLRIKSFVGTTENAVMTQVLVALILYPLFSVIKFQPLFTVSKTALLRIIREVLLETSRQPIQLSFL